LTTVVRCVVDERKTKADEDDVAVKYAEEEVMLT
jgi:hypothetical protein